ncbi:MAG: hypothetical protein IKB85_05015 [Bacteroidales bacterium]|nr:hypothetical protein [Bacteroidales bacterium]
MKKLALIITTLLFSVSVFAQEDVTKFLGIPVDGFKPEMIRKLKAKGYTEHSYKPDVLVGEFNGRDVEVSVVTNNNKVYRIFVQDAYTVDEYNIKIRYNTLCEQFENNKRYISMAVEGQSIPDDEDISDQMLYEDKRYEALYFQVPEQVDTLAVQTALRERVLAKYTEEQLANPTSEMQEEVLKATFDIAFEIYKKKSVWFTINKEGNRYRILMYYDNKYNEANGEDL